MIKMIALKNRIFVFIILAVFARGVCFADDIAAVITALSGKVESRKSGEKLWVESKKGQFLYEGDTLRTLAGSKAAVTFVNGIEVKMNENSNFTIEPSKPSEKGKGNTVNMSSGQIWSKTMRKGSQFDIKTPAATVAIRGSSFDAKASGKAILAKCYEGGGYLENKFGRSQLKAGQKAQATSGKAPAQAVPLADNERETWQRDVKSKGSIKMAAVSAVSPKPEESIKIEISVVDESDEVVDDFGGVIALSSLNRELSFSGDSQNWKDRIMFKLKNGKGAVYAKAGSAGVYMINAETTDDFSPSFLRINVAAERKPAAASEKTLKLDVRSEDGSVKQLELKLR